MLAEYEEGAVPICYGWLPSKEAISYHTYMMLILTEFNKIRGNKFLTVKRIKCDFERSIHKVFYCFH